MVEIVHPPRRIEMNKEDREQVEALRERGKRLYQGMRTLAKSVDEPSAKAVSPRESSDEEDTGNRTWIEMRVLPTWEEPGRTREHMWFMVDMVDLEDDEPLSSPRAYLGITACGKLLPEPLRDPEIVSFDKQSELIDAMVSRLGSIRQATAQIAIEAA